MEIHFQPATHHPNGIVNARLIVKDEFLWKQMEHLAIRRQRNLAGAVNRRTDIFASDFALTIPQTDAAATIHPANMCTADSRNGSRNHAVATLFGQCRSMTQAFDRRLQLGDQPFAHALRLDHSVTQIAQRAFMHFAGKHTSFVRAHVKHCHH
jgi:hypothetical protein